MSEERLSYYKENLPKLIERLKSSVDKTLAIIDKEIDEDLSDDKYLNVLKARRQASEDVIWTLKRIDELENELNGVEDEELQREALTIKNFAKQRAQQRKGRR